jgi:hypothetical protein
VKISEQELDRVKIHHAISSATPYVNKGLVKMADQAGLNKQSLSYCQAQLGY